MGIVSIINGCWKSLGNLGRGAAFLSMLSLPAVFGIGCVSHHAIAESGEIDAIKPKDLGEYTKKEAEQELIKKVMSGGRAEGLPGGMASGFSGTPGKDFLVSDRKARISDLLVRRHTLDYLPEQESICGFLELGASVLGGSARFPGTGAGGHVEHNEVLKGRFYASVIPKIMDFDAKGSLGYSGHNMEMNPSEVENYSRISSNLDAAILLMFGSVMAKLGVQVKHDSYQELLRGTTPMFEDHQDDAAVSSYDLGPLIGLAIDLKGLQVSLSAGRPVGKAVFDATTPWGETLRADRYAGFVQLNLRAQTDKELFGLLKDAYMCFGLGAEYIIDKYNMASIRQETLQTSGEILAGGGIIDVDGDGRKDIGIAAGFGFWNVRSYGDRFRFNNTSWGPRIEFPIALGDGLVLALYVGHRQLGGYNDGEAGFRLDLKY